MQTKNLFTVQEEQLRKVVREEIKNELATTKIDLIDAFTKIATDFKSDILNSVDKVMGELENLRTEGTAQSEKISEHDDRLSTLEKAHPGLQP